MHECLLVVELLDRSVSHYPLVEVGHEGSPSPFLVPEMLHVPRQVFIGGVKQIDRNAAAVPEILADDRGCAQGQSFQLRGHAAGTPDAEREFHPRIDRRHGVCCLQGHVNQL